MSKAMRQMLEQSGRVGVARGEAVRDLISDEARGPLLEHPDTGSVKSMAGTGGLLEAALTRQNLQAAWKRVKANKGAAGGGRARYRVNGPMDAHTLARHPARAAGRKISAPPVRRVMIPKPDGSQRELGIPTVLDRLIQQALLQVLQPLIDPGFSERSHGFRPGWRAHDAVKAARVAVGSGQTSDGGRGPGQIP